MSPLQAVSFNFLPSQYQAGLALEQRKEKEEGKEHSEVLQDTVWKWSEDSTLSNFARTILADSNWLFCALELLSQPVLYFRIASQGGEDVY